MYGSKMGILHSASGQWLLNITSSPSLTYYAISNFRNISCKLYYPIYIIYCYLVCIYCYLMCIYCYLVCD